LSWTKKQFGQHWPAILIYIILVVFFLFNFTAYLHQYFHHYPRDSWRYWAYGYKEVMLDLNKLEKDYGQVYIDNDYEPSILWFLFWHQYPPREFQQNLTDYNYQNNILPGIDGFNVGKFCFFKINQPGQKESVILKILAEKKNSLFLISQEKNVSGDWDWRKNPPGGVKVLDSVANPFNQPIFYLITHE
jgi:hypothetical protein